MRPISQGLGHVVDVGWPAALDSLWQRVGAAFGVIADATRPPVLDWLDDALGRPVEAGEIPPEVFEAAARDRDRSDADRRLLLALALELQQMTRWIERRPPSFVAT